MEAATYRRVEADYNFQQDQGRNIFNQAGTSNSVAWECKTKSGIFNQAEVSCTTALRQKQLCYALFSMIISH